MSNFVYASYNGSQLGVTVRTMDLVQINFVPTKFKVADVAAGGNDDFFICSANGIYHYNNAGTLLNTMIFPDTGVNYISLSVRGNRLYAAYVGSQVGFTVRDLNLVQQSFVALPFNPSGIAAGKDNNVYLTGANSIYNYGTNGTLINTFTWPSTSINYTSVTTFCDRVYAGYNGSQLGFTVRNLDLVQQNAVSTGFNVASVAAGPNKDVYLASTNHLYLYEEGGTQLIDMNFPDPGVDYNGVSACFSSLT